MNRIMLTSLFLFFIVSHCITAFPSFTHVNKRQDETSGFKNCDGQNFPIAISKLTFDPNPIVLGKEVTTTVAGTSKGAIQPGAKQITTGSYQGQQLFSKTVDFCKVAEANGEKCPTQPGDFTQTSTGTVQDDPKIPKGTAKIDIKSQIVNPDGGQVMCIQGPLTFTKQ